MHIIDKILSLIKEKNITASKLSEDIDISSGLISQWKKRLQNPSFDVIVKIADYFDVSIDYLPDRANGMSRANWTKKMRCVV